MRKPLLVGVNAQRCNGIGPKVYLPIGEWNICVGGVEDSVLRLHAYVNHESKYTRPLNGKEVTVQGPVVVHVEFMETGKETDITVEAVSVK